MSQDHQVTLLPGGRRFDVRSDETILAAATRHAVRLPSRCRNGSCGRCVARRIVGEISHVICPAVALEPDQVCLCLAKAICDVELYVQDDPEPQRRLRRLPAKVMVTVEGAVDLITLQLPPMAQAALAEGCRFEIKAPAPHAGLLTVVSMTSQRTVLVRWQASAGTCLNGTPTFLADDVLQVELLV